MVSLALALPMRSRNVPGPLSAELVTINTAPQACGEDETRVSAIGRRQILVNNAVEPDHAKKEAIVFIKDIRGKMGFLQLKSSFTNGDYRSSIYSLKQSPQP